MKIRASQHNPRGGFTLIEMLVVVGVIVFLAAISIPTVMYAYRKSVATRTAADMQSIATALEAYKLDFGDYPRPEIVGTGFTLLGKALIGPGGFASSTATNPSAAAWASRDYLAGECVSTGTGANYREFVAIPPPAGDLRYVVSGANSPPGATYGAGQLYWASPPVATPSAATFLYPDGADGAGFRVRFGGKVWGPYLSPDKFKFHGLAIVDASGNPILYSPARPGKPNLGLAGGYILCADGLASPPLPPIFNAAENLQFFMRPSDLTRPNAVQRMNALLGDFTTDSAATNFDGRIELDVGETAATTGPYLLWSAGADGMYGVNPKVGNAIITKDDIAKCDDVTNFK